MLRNFTRPDGEEPYYYSTTVEKGKIVKHDGDPEYAMYKSEMREMDRRANLWHKWVDNNIPNAYNGLGIMDESVFVANHKVNRQFMDGEREE